jgi:peptidyl-prolyl cis-trans isomerase SurA
MRIVSDPYRVDSLPSFYKSAVEKLKPNEISASFEIPSLPVNKVAIVQILTRNESGVRTYAERHEQLRAYVQQAASMRHLLDALRKETYVSIRLDTPMKIVQ